jgi:ribosomal protein S18 acetylase RimI-like enzyme
MKLSISYNPPDKIEYYELFESSGWNSQYKLSPGLLFETLKNSWFMACTYNEKKLIGFGRVISDGILHALIVDLIVAPGFQDCGIGKLLLNELVSKCKSTAIPDIQLFCAKGKEGFYIKQGFKSRPKDAPGMEFIGL